MSGFAILAIARRFLRQQLRNTTAVVMLFAVPLMIAAVLGFADQRANTVLPVGIYLNGARLSGAQTLAALRDAEALRMQTFSSHDDLILAVRTGNVVAGVEFPDNYDDDVARGQTPPLVLYGQPSQSTYKAASTDLFLVVARENVLAIGAQQRALKNNSEFLDELTALRKEVQHAPVAGTRVTASHGTHAFGLGRFTAGMLVFFIFDSAMFHAAIFRDDRRRGVMARMTTTPNRASVLALGELVGRTVLGALQGAVIVVAGSLLFRLHWGNPLAVGAIIVAFTLVSTGAGLLVGVVGRGRTAAETESATAGLIAVLGLAGGCFWPLSVVPDWLRVTSHASPHAWANDAFDRLLATNAGIGQIWVPLAVLGGLALACTALAVSLFPRAARR